MKICLSGATGLIGRALQTHLRKEGCDVRLLIRKESDRQNAKDTRWDPENESPPPQTLLEALSGTDALVHLSGAGIAETRWHAARRKLLWRSRINSTQLLTTALGQLPKAKRPKTLICASAIGYYPYGTSIQNEDSPAGNSFLSNLCLAWEKSAEQAAKRYDLRVVCLRIGLVLSAEGGVLAPLLRAEKLRMSVAFGSGAQYMSWIHIHDMVRLITQALRESHWQGAYNAVGPTPIRQKELLRTLAQAVGHPRAWIPPFPAPLLRLALGEMSNLILKGQRIHPTRALSAGFQFRFLTLKEALDDLLTGPSL